MAGNFINDLIGGVSNLGSIGVQAFGTNLPLSPLISYRDTFLKHISEWETSFPNESLWLLYIDVFPDALSTELLQELEGRGNGNSFDIDRYVMTINLKYGPGPNMMIR